MKEMKVNFNAKCFKQNSLIFVLGLVVVCLASVSNVFSKTNGLDSSAFQTSSLNLDLMQAYIGTAKYHRESAALADGFFSTQECVAVPNLGGMGIHYVNLARSRDTQVNAAEPENLLYEPTDNGRMRLVGVEYYAPVLVNGQPWFSETPPPTIDNPAPVLFGHSFDGPMPGHGPGQPWHYDLHVWIWKQNPLGMFAPFNPKVSCSSDK
jgi:hypothetical protein